MQKFSKDVQKAEINAIIRRCDSTADGKVTFKEFSIGISPEYPGLEHEKMEFNVDRKAEHVKA